MDNGFILLSRGILDSDVFASQKLLKIWVWCLCKANFKDKTIPLRFGRGEIIVKVKRGSFVFGRNKAEEELFIDGSTIYKSINKLKEMDMIKIESNNQYSIITICNYDSYQQMENYQVTSKEQVSNSLVTAKEQLSNTTKNDNNDNNDNNIEKNKKKTFEFRENEFRDSLLEFKIEFGESIVNDFFNYWSEPDKHQKMKFEKEKTWETKRRLLTWIKRDKTFNQKNKFPQTIEEKFEHLL